MVFSSSSVIKLNKKGCILIILVLLVFAYFNFYSSENNKNPAEVNLKDLLKLAIKAAETGGKLVVSTKNNLEIHSKGKTQEGMDDRVTTADFLSHCAMAKIIQDNYPNIELISEEQNVPCSIISSVVDNVVITADPIIDIMEDDFVKQSDLNIWIDPLDATHEYTEKLYQYVTTMVCVAVNGAPIIGVIHNPFKKITWWAVVGNGHSANLNPVPNSRNNDKIIKVIVSRSHSGTIKEVVAKLCPNCEFIVAAGAGYKVIQVAQGAVDAYLHNTAIKKWDICAGNAILNELGGKMTNKHGELLNYSNFTDFLNRNGLIAAIKNYELFKNII